jgi:hypothetical protein
MGLDQRPGRILVCQRPPEDTGMDDLTRGRKRGGRLMKAVLSAVVLFGAIQLVPYGRKHEKLSAHLG